MLSASEPFLPSDDEYQTGIARMLLELSTACWGREQATILIGRHPRLEDTLTRLVRFAAAEGSILITGETGTGKDLLARSVFLSAKTHRRTLLSVNCAQFQNDQLAASELFGHRRGAFTGALTDHRGIFEEADGGMVFLDEVAELPLTVQAMLLRVLNHGEMVPVGATQPRRVDVRVIAATNRDLPLLVARGSFREDLYYRLRYLTLHAPPLRERGDDWQLVARYLFGRLARRYGAAKAFAPATLERLASYPWPGNVRELASCVEVGYHLAATPAVRLEDLEGALQHMQPGTTAGVGAVAPRVASAPPRAPSATPLAQMLGGEATFWTAVHAPFIAREMNRAEVRAIVAEGLRRTHGSYKRLVRLFGLPETDYARFMDFLRHHDLKPHAALAAVNIVALSSGGAADLRSRGARPGEEP